LSPSYVHPLPPPTSPATHTLRTLTLRQSTPSQPQHLLHWRAISQASESIPLLRAAGAIRVRGMRFPNIVAVLRLGEQKRAPTWISCGGWRKCRRWRHSASDGRTAGRRRYARGICASLLTVAAFITVAQRVETPANTSPLQKDEAMSGMSPYPHQARTETTVGSFQDQARRR
jgi:hypothetical protein